MGSALGEDRPQLIDLAEDADEQRDDSKRHAQAADHQRERPRSLKDTDEAAHDADRARCDGRPIDVYRRCSWQHSDQDVLDDKRHQAHEDDGRRPAPARGRFQPAY